MEILQILNPLEGEGETMSASVLIRRDNRRLSKRLPIEVVQQNIAVYSFRSQLGWMAVASDGALVDGLTFGHDSAPAAIRAMEQILTAAPDLTGNLLHASTVIQSLIQKLQAFAQGKAEDFHDVPLDLAHLTPFGIAVTQRCREIEWGETLSYRELAASCGRPRAARAVGNIMRRNRFPLIVPCHRVLATGGGLGGYSAPQGLAMKERLLELERRR